VVFTLTATTTVFDIFFREKTEIISGTYKTTLRTMREDQVKKISFSLTFAFLLNLQKVDKLKKNIQFHLFIV
jgi:hypothetical protein